MIPDKEIKAKFRPVFWKDPDKYYATSVLKEDGFTRHVCSKCKKPFWSIDQDRKVCGDPACSSGFEFIGHPTKNKLGYIEVWKEFSSMFKKLGYTPIKRYPVVARWNPTMEYTNASIAAFQPYVISGEVKPPANPLVIPQFCLRFTDIDNVGITMSHNTGFVMIGQHMFVRPEEWDQNKVFSDIHQWLKKGIGLPNKEIIFHEDAWAGGGNFGCCMEFFSKGCELGNQVYMLYEQTPNGYKELGIKVLDMGMGQERNAWFSSGSNTIYEATFPTVCQKLFSKTGIKVDKELLKKFVPYAGFLNIDEVEDIDKAWKSVANKLSMDVKELKKNIMPLSGVFSIGEHVRSLLVSLSDSALPSNIGFGYNLRILIRRALSFIDQYGWDVSLPEVAEWHAEFLKPMFPELSEHLDEISKILDAEKSKYNATKQKSRQIISKLVKQKITDKQLLELYDSNGISPELIREEAAKLNKAVNVPVNFYTMVSELHNQKEGKGEEKEEREKLDLEDVKETKALYFDDYRKTEFKARVVKIIGKYVILDKTYFYPTSGGQMHDAGTIAGENVVDVFKQGNVIVHLLSGNHQFPVGEEVNCKIDFDARKQLAQHHTATHIINAAARRVLGKHINQAGAKKTVERAHLDITHYQSISDEELEKIENEANKIIKGQIPVKLSFMSRDEAEKRHGLLIYQGGAVPGKLIRIVEIPEVDVEACAGTHVNNTKEIGSINILKSTKISDAVVRIFFTAGAAAQHVMGKEKDMLERIAGILNIEVEQIPGRAEELFVKWKKARKSIKKNKAMNVKELNLVSKETFKGDILAKTAEIFKTQPEHIEKTARRFLSELEDMKKELEKRKI